MPCGLTVVVAWDPLTYRGGCGRQLLVEFEKSFQEPILVLVRLGHVQIYVVVDQSGRNVGEDTEEVRM